MSFPNPVIFLDFSLSKSFSKSANLDETEGR